MVTCYTSPHIMVDPAPPFRPSPRQLLVPRGNWNLIALLWVNTEILHRYTYIPSTSFKRQAYYRCDLTSYARRRPPSKIPKVLKIVFKLIFKRREVSKILGPSQPSLHYWSGLPFYKQSASEFKPCKNRIRYRYTHIKVEAKEEQVWCAVWKWQLRNPAKRYSIIKYEPELVYELVYELSLVRD